MTRTLDVASEPLESRGDVEIARMTFDNGSGDRGTALTARRSGSDGAAVGVLIAHGGFEPGADIFVDEACGIAQRGAAVILPETTFPRSHDVEAHEVAIERAIRLQRRAIDVLAVRFGAARFGFFGHSAGGAQGAILSAVEPRVGAIVIAATGARLLSRMRESLIASDMERIARFDPEWWVSSGGDRAVLFQHGLRDDVVPYENARHLYDVAAGRKEWAEYECGHGVDGHAPARSDRLAFFERELGL